MPIYTYKCKDCEAMTDSYNMISTRHQSPACECGGETVLSIQPTQLAPVLGGGDFPGYKCPVTDEFITSRRKRKYVMESNNLIEVGDRAPSKERRIKTENKLHGITPEKPKVKEEAHWEHFS